MGKILFIIIITVYIAKSENGVPPTTHPYCVSSKHQRSPYISSPMPYHTMTKPYHTNCAGKYISCRHPSPFQPPVRKCTQAGSGQWTMNVFEFPIPQHWSCACLWIDNISALYVCMSLYRQYPNCQISKHTLKKIGLPIWPKWKDSFKVTSDHLHM